MASHSDAGEGDRKSTKTLLEDVCADFETIDVAHPKVNKSFVSRPKTYSRTRNVVPKLSVSAQQSTPSESTNPTDLDKAGSSASSSSAPQVELKPSQQSTVLSQNVAVLSVSSDNQLSEPARLGGETNLSSLAQLADAEIVQTDDNSVSIIISNPRLIQVKTSESSPVMESSSSSALESASSSCEPISVVESSIISNIEIQDLDMAISGDTSVLNNITLSDQPSPTKSTKIPKHRGLKTFTPSEELIDKKYAIKFPKRRGRPPKNPIPPGYESKVKPKVNRKPNDPSVRKDKLPVEKKFIEPGMIKSKPVGKKPASASVFQQSRPWTKARRVTVKMKEMWAKQLQEMGHIACDLGCNQTYITVANFVTHYKFCTGKKNLLHCPYCDSLIFSSSVAVMRHMEVEHPEKIEEYKAKFPEQVVEYNESEAASECIVTEDEKIDMNVGEVILDASNPIMKRHKSACKENVLPPPKAILKQKMKSINEKVNENIQEFKKCVRFDQIIDQINSVEEFTQVVEDVSVPTKKRYTPRGLKEPAKRKNRKHIIDPKFVEERKYFEDDEDDIYACNIPDETQSEEMKYTKARMVLNLERYKRYKEYLKVTRDWSSERKTYSRSKGHDTSFDSSFDFSCLTSLPQECIQDVHQMDFDTLETNISLKYEKGNDDDLDTLTNDITLMSAHETPSVSEKDIIVLRSIEEQGPDNPLNEPNRFQVLFKQEPNTSTPLSGRSMKDSLNMFDRSSINSARESMSPRRMRAAAIRDGGKIPCYNAVESPSPATHQQNVSGPTSTHKSVQEPIVKNKPTPKDPPPITFDRLVRETNLLPSKVEKQISVKKSLKKLDHPSNAHLHAVASQLEGSKINLKKKRCSAAVLNSLKHSARLRNTKLMKLKLSAKLKSGAQRISRLSQIRAAKAGQRKIQKHSEQVKSSLNALQNVENELSDKESADIEPVVQIIVENDPTNLNQAPYLAVDHNYSTADFVTIDPMNVIAEEIEVVSSNIENPCEEIIPDVNEIWVEPIVEQVDAQAAVSDSLLIADSCEMQQENASADVDSLKDAVNKLSHQVTENKSHEGAAESQLLEEREKENNLHKKQAENSSHKEEAEIQLRKMESENHMHEGEAANRLNKRKAEDLLHNRESENGPHQEAVENQLHEGEEDNQSLQKEAENQLCEEKDNQLHEDEAGNSLHKEKADDQKHGKAENQLREEVENQLEKVDVFSKGNSTEAIEISSTTTNLVDSEAAKIASSKNKEIEAICESAQVNSNENIIGKETAMDMDQSTPKSDAVSVSDKNLSNNDQSFSSSKDSSQNEKNLLPDNVSSCAVSNDSHIETKVDEPAQDAPVKRGRGRPKKNKALPVASAVKKDPKPVVKQSVTPTTVETKKMRLQNSALREERDGVRKSERVKKRKLAVDEVPETPKVEPKTHGPQVVLIKTGRRGRPRKCLIPGPEETADDSKQDVSTPLEADLVGKNDRKYLRKGQPRKCVKYIDINSGIESSDSLDGISSGSNLKGKTSAKEYGVKEPKTVPTEKDLKEKEEKRDEEKVLPLKKRKQRKNKSDARDTPGDTEAEIQLLQDTEIPAEALSKGVDGNLNLSEEGNRSGRSQRSRKMSLKRKLAEEDEVDLSSDEDKESVRDPDFVEYEPKMKGKSNKYIVPKISGSYDRQSRPKPPSCLFMGYKPKKYMWQLLNEKNYQEFLPPLQYSAYFKIKKSWSQVESDWTTLKCFDSLPLDNDSPHVTFFTGGPVLCSAWCPIPHESQQTQHVAVSISSTLDKYCSYSDTEPRRGIVQIWSLGLLRSKNPDSQPVMDLSISHSHGYVSSMAWCPAGCWEDPSTEMAGQSLPRLGLLALACSDSCVRVYSVPHPESLPEPKDPRTHPVYSACPSMVLKAIYGGTCLATSKSICSCVSWQKSDRCERIAAGYGNGMVCIWLLNSSSTILSSEENGQLILSPYQIFNAHGAPVTSLSFSPLPGARFLLTSSLDRTAKFWDLLDTSLPFYSIKKGASRQVDWLDGYVGALVSLETGFVKGGSFFKECGVENNNFRISSNPCCSTLGMSVSKILSAQALADLSGLVSVNFFLSHVSDRRRNFERPVYEVESQCVKGLLKRLPFMNETEMMSCSLVLNQLQDTVSTVQRLVASCGKKRSIKAVEDSPADASLKLKKKLCLKPLTEEEINQKNIQIASSQLFDMSDIISAASDVEDVVASMTHMTEHQLSTEVPFKVCSGLAQIDDPKTKGVTQKLKSLFEAEVYCAEAEQPAEEDNENKNEALWTGTLPNDIVSSLPNTSLEASEPVTHTIDILSLLKDLKEMVTHLAYLADMVDSLRIPIPFVSVMDSFGKGANHVYDSLISDACINDSLAVVEVINSLVTLTSREVASHAAVDLLLLNLVCDISKAQETVASGSIGSVDKRLRQSQISRRPLDQKSSSKDQGSMNPTPVQHSEVPDLTSFSLCNLSSMAEKSKASSFASDAKSQNKPFSDILTAVQDMMTQIASRVASSSSESCHRTLESFDNLLKEMTQSSEICSEMVDIVNAVSDLKDVVSTMAQCSNVSIASSSLMPFEEQQTSEEQNHVSADVGVHLQANTSLDSTLLYDPADVAPTLELTSSSLMDLESDSIDSIPVLMACDRDDPQSVLNEDVCSQPPQLTSEGEDKELLCVDSESSNSENEEDFEEPGEYFFDQESNFSQDSRISECSLESDVSMGSDDSVLETSSVPSDVEDADGEEDDNHGEQDSPGRGHSGSPSLEMADPLSTSQSSDCRTNYSGSVLPPSSEGSAALDPRTVPELLDASSDPPCLPVEESCEQDKLSSSSADISVEAGPVLPTSADVPKPSSETVHAETVGSGDQSDRDLVQVSECQPSEQPDSSANLNVKLSDISAAESVPSQLVISEVSSSAELPVTANIEHASLNVHSDPPSEVSHKSIDNICDSNDARVSGSEELEMLLEDEGEDLSSRTQLNAYEDILLENGIVFNDMNTADFESIKDISGLERVCPSHKHDLMIINSVAFNPNQGSHNWLFSAGHAGIARLSFISDLKKFKRD